MEVPKWWSRLMSVGVATSFVVAVIAFGISIAALREANEDDASDGSSTAVIAESAAAARRAPPAPANEAENESESERALPGTAEYDGYHPQPPNRFLEYFDFIVHGHVSLQHFARLQKGIDDAAQLINVDVSYFQPEMADDVANHESIATHILNARRSLKNGIAVSFLQHDADLVEALDEAAHDMPVLSLLLDQDIYRESGVNTFINLGFANELAGIFAGDRFRNAGVERALCLLNDRDIFGQQSSCDAFEGALQPIENITRVADASDPELMRNMVATAVENDEVQGILTIGPEAFTEAHAYLTENDLLCDEQRNFSTSDCILLATYDETDEILQAIVDGHVAFAMDNQQYLQGFLAVLYLRIRATYHSISRVQRPLLTGPVPIDNAEEAERRLKRNLMKGETIDGREPKDLDVRFIVHGKISDPFWTEVKNGVRRAAREIGVPIDFRHPDSSITAMDDIIASQINMIEEAGAEGVDALILTLPANDSALRRAIENVYESTRVPIMTINAGHRWFQDLPIQAHIGLVEFFEGEGVAEKLLDVNVDKALCVVYEKDNDDLTERCRDIRRNGVEIIILDAFEGEDFHTDMPDRTETIKEAVMASLEEDRDLQAVVSTGLLATEGVHSALSEMDRFCIGDERPTDRNNTCIEFVAFDVSPLVFTYIANDEMLFAVDQQPGMQGYLPVYFAMIEALYGNRPFGLVPTGPFFVDASDVAIQAQLYGFLAAN